MGRRSLAMLAVACLLLTSCDDFLEITVHNPCSFAVVVAFAGESFSAPESQPWPYAEPVAAESAKSIVTGAPAAHFPYSERVQVLAVDESRPPFTDVVVANEDGYDWFIPESFCG